jgi:hypothetical protein
MELVINELDYEDIPENQKFNTPVKPNDITNKKAVSYEDILSKMNMYVSNGKLHLVDRNDFNKIAPHANLNPSNPISNPSNPNPNNPISNPSNPNNSYIHNKYFKNTLTQNESNVRKPQTLQEYKLMLLQDYIQKQKIKQIKSTKLVMPTNNISMAYSQHNLDKLFTFSQR